jgi:hypothetical protein
MSAVAQYQHDLFPLFETERHTGMLQAQVRIEREVVATPPQHEHSQRKPPHHRQWQRPQGRKRRQTEQQENQRQDAGRT